QRAAASLAKAGVKADDVATGINDLAVARNNANAAMDVVLKKLKDDKYLGPNDERSKVPQGVDEALKVARMKEPEAKIATSGREIKRLEGVLAQRWTPAQMLDSWLSVIQTTSDPEQTVRAMTDVQRVLGDKDTPASARAKALAILGIALRKEG